ncbi:MAG: NAD(P)-dependent oxidoreductase [Thermoleophilaceae bacterium]
MRVFVAGATGAIGRPLVRQLVDAGHDVTAASRSAGRAEWLRELGAEPVGCDALDPAAVEAAVSQARPEAIVNELTAIPAAIDPRKMAEQFAQTNRLRSEGTANLMAAAEAHGVRRLVSQSVAFAYASTAPGSTWTEDDALADDGELTDALHELERRTLGSPRVEGVVLRYGFFYGPGTVYSTAGSSAELARKRRFPLIGGSDGMWPFVHVDDAAAATVAALDRGAPGVYNAVDDEPARYGDWLPAFADAVGAKPPRRVPRWLARIAAGPQVVRYATELQPVSNEKAKRELGWQPRHPSWRQGFREALD